MFRFFVGLDREYIITCLISGITIRLFGEASKNKTHSESPPECDRIHVAGFPSTSKSKDRRDPLRTLRVHDEQSESLHCYRRTTLLCSGLRFRAASAECSRSNPNSDGMYLWGHSAVSEISVYSPRQQYNNMIHICQ
jgi:hypothetical protein